MSIEPFFAKESKKGAPLVSDVQFSSHMLLQDVFHSRRFKKISHGARCADNGFANLPKH